ncbi:MAG TPA: sodium/solute symporter, partial [Terrimicrobiaceae bacterium]|nr:sodium/solute symporter [Terrimicrobiaceae bacterium]
AAAVLDGKLHVLGGAVSFAPLTATADFWVLDLAAPSAWRPGPPFPGAPRAFAAATEQYGMLCLFGGRNERPLAETWVFRSSPLEGTKDSGWKRLTDLPAPAAGATALPMGQAQVLVIGGGDPAGNDGDAARPLLFHTLTDAWCAFDVQTGLSRPVASRIGTSIFALGAGPDGRPAAVQLDATRSVRNLGWPDYVVIVLYFAFISGIGFYFSRKQESSAEFSLGNRKVVWWAAGISMFATGASAISFMAIPALAFATNLVWLFPLLVMIPAYFVTAYWIFPLLRRMEITSTYEYLERRFNRTLRIIASLQCIFFQTFARTSVVLVLPALAISSVTGINVFLSVLLMGIITTIYTAIGGFDAVIWTEVFQGLLKFLAPLVMIGICIAALPGGAGEVLSTSLTYRKFDFALLTWDVAVPAFWILMIGTFLTATVSAAGDQPIIQRVFSAPLHEVRRVNAMSTACGILIGVIVNVMGLAIFAYFRAHPDKFDPNAQNDQIVPLFVTQAMPTGMAGVVVAAIFASAMATVASAMNSVATIFTEDFYLKFRPKATDRERLFTLRATSYAVGAIGTAMALLLAAQNLKSMMIVWSQFTALLGGGIVGVYTLGMFSRRANGFGAICGAIFSITLTLAVKLFTDLHWATYTPIAIFSCIGAGYLCSLFSPQRKDLAGLTVYTPARQTP